MKIVLVLAATLGVSLATLQCDVSSTVNCGAGKDPALCESLGCCYDSSKSPKCFHSANACDRPNACIPGSTCTNLGAAGSGQWSCTCPEGYPEDYDCRGTEGSCAVSPTNRIACGAVSGSNKRQMCEERGCCWDDSIAGTKWCFHPVDVVVKDALVCDDEL